MRSFILPRRLLVLVCGLIPGEVVLAASSQLLLLNTWTVAACLFAQESIAPPAPDAIPRLPVTTGWLGNSLLRGGQADWSDKSQTFLQLYTSDMAVTGPHHEWLGYVAELRRTGSRHPLLERSGISIPLRRLSAPRLHS